MAKLYLAYDKTMHKLITMLKFNDQKTAISTDENLTSWMPESQYYVGTGIVILSEHPTTRDLKNKINKLLNEMTGMSYEEKHEYILSMGGN